MGKIPPGRVETGPFSAGRNASGGAKRRLCLMKRSFRRSETEAPSCRNKASAGREKSAGKAER
ncbi:hypothetical protein M1B74_04760 [Bacteroides pyogenes]|uniref:hypothetical protein n=1 Tax=Bacteroides pyogenes TaxID=310300 RepID=UPI003B43CF0D